MPVVAPITRTFFPEKSYFTCDMSALPPPCGPRPASSLATASLCGRSGHHRATATFVNGCNRHARSVHAQRLDQLLRAKVFDTDNTLHKKNDRCQCTFSTQQSRVERAAPVCASRRLLSAHPCSPAARCHCVTCCNAEIGRAKLAPFRPAMARGLGTGAREAYHSDSIMEGSIATSKKLLHDTAIKTE